MNENQLQEFNPTVAELTNIAESYKGMKINGVEDKEGFEKVKIAKKDLSEKRNFITKTLKAYRENALKFQKDVIAKEKELVGIIEPVEDELKAELERINNEIEMNERRAILPMRMRELQEAGETRNISENTILFMDDNEFMIHINGLKAQKYEEQKKKIEEMEAKEKAEQDRVKREQEIKEAQEVAREQAERKAKIDAEIAEKKAEQDKIEAEKRHQEEIERIKRMQEYEAETKKLAEEKAQKEIENGKLFQEFLSNNGYNENTKNDYFIVYGEPTILYKKVASFTTNK